MYGYCVVRCLSMEQITHLEGAYELNETDNTVMYFLSPS